jgi:hypothetical protein
MADYLEMARAPEQSGRFVRERMGTREANAIVDLVAVAESFCVARLASVGVGSSANTWIKRAKAWKACSVDVDGYIGWSALMGFVEARNAVQHGLGRLTDRQLEDKYKKQTLGWLKAAEVRLNGDMIILAEADVTRCAQTSADFIRWLDLAAQVAADGAVAVQAIGRQPA